MSADIEKYLPAAKRLSGFKKSIKVHNQKVEKLQIGNCMMACYANILGFEQEHCPPIEELMETMIPRRFWWDVLNLWLDKLGYILISTEDETEAIANTCDPHGLYFAIGSSVRCNDSLHQVIYRGGKLFFDPNPTGNGLIKVTIFEYLIRK